MKLVQFKVKNKKKKIIIGSVIVVILLLSITLLIRTFAIYKETNEFNVINGMVPDQFYDAMFTFYQMDESGNKTPINTIPEGKNWDVSVTCNKGAIGLWDITDWGPTISNFTESRTKCGITFAPPKPLLSNIIKQNIVTSGVGVYEVNHSEAIIGTHMNATQMNNLKQTEYRYAGQNPNNYVLFNNELWRIIGFVNTPEGPRVKLIRSGSIGECSWDSSDSSSNGGIGINEWSTSDIMKLLNPGYESEAIGGSLYWNKQSGNCYNGSTNANSLCDFTSNGLTVEAQTKIDTVTWTTGTNGTNDYVSANNGLTKHFYNYERSNNGKICTTGDSCNDTVNRTTTWNGKVGLISPSDYGYASSGGITTNRITCLNKELFDWNNSTLSDCKNNDWIFNSTYQWLFNSYALSNSASNVFYLNNIGYVHHAYANRSSAIHPSVYLNSETKVLSGEGTKNNPYTLN